MVKIDVKPEQRHPVKCAWCGKIIYHTTIANSDGICSECKEGLLLTSHLTRKKQS
jgi:acetyl-CoA carboxylase beta subunit